MNFVARRPDVPLTKFKRAYFVGIKGVGMASLAVLLKQAGLEVSGADTEETFVTDKLLSEQAIPVDFFSAAILPDDVDVVIFSGAHQGEANPLVQQARKKKLIVLSHAQALGALTQRKTTIAVAGVGGKSTTSALLSWMLEVDGASPSFSVGVGEIPNLGTSGRWVAGGQHFVIEADEYVADPKNDVTPRFLYTEPRAAIITSLSFDHPDVYTSFEETKKAFSAFLDKIGDHGVVVYNGDMPALRELVDAHTGGFRRVSVGEHKHNFVRIEQFLVKEGIGSVVLQSSGSKVGGVTLRSRIPGKHNLLNASYAAVMASELGVENSSIAQAVASFRSTKRRFEFVGETVRGCQCFDDYAHHPREIEAIGSALKDWFPGKKFSLAFEPHTFSRTKALYQEFLNSLISTGADLALLPIFASARENFDPSITSEMIVEDLARQGINATFCPDYGVLLEYIQALGDETVFITLGAGTIYKVYEHVAFVSTPEPLS